MQDYNKQADEFGKSAEELRSTHDNRAFPDSQPSAEMRQPPENNVPAKRRGKHRSGADIARAVSSFLTATVATVAIGISVPSVQNAISPSAGASVEALKIVSDSDDLYYELMVDGGGEELDVVLYNDFVSRRQELESGVNVGVFENLQTGVKYTLAVLSDGLLGESELASWEVKIKSHPIDLARAELISLEADAATVRYSIITEGELPLNLVIQGDGVHKAVPLSSGMNEGALDVPTASVARVLTLSVVGEGPMGEQAILTEELELPPLNAGTAIISEYGTDANLVYFNAEAESEFPLKAILSGGDYYAELEAQNGMTEGAFENLPYNTSFTLSIVAETPYGAVALSSVDVSTQHQIDFTTVEILELSRDGSELYFTLNAMSTVDLSTLGLKISLLSSDGARLSTMDFDPTNGGELEPPQDPCFAEMFASFPGILESEKYTVIVEGQGPDGAVLLASAESRIPHPIDFTYVEISELSPDGTELYFTVTASSEVDLDTLGLKISLLSSDGTRLSTVDFDPTNGGELEPPQDPCFAEMFSSFSGISLGELYTVIVEGQGPDGTVLLASSEITLEAPIL